MDNSQLLKGILEGCILKIISKKETYGYEIILKLNENGFDNILEGTLYPILTRLENKKYIISRREKSPIGPYRKYYSISEMGQKKLNEFINNYKNINKSANIILLGGEENESK